MKMHNTTVKKLRVPVIRNVIGETASLPSHNSLERHIHIYMLIDEYNCLCYDLESSTEYSSPLIEKRMKEIEKELISYWIIKEDDIQGGN